MREKEKAYTIHIGEEEEEEKKWKWNSLYKQKAWKHHNS